MASTDYLTINGSQIDLVAWDAALDRCTPFTRGGISDMWRQPLPSGPPKQYTHFPSGLIYAFAWTPDGKTLVLARGTRTADIILLKATKKPQ